MCNPFDSSNLPEHLQKQAEIICGNSDIEGFKVDTQRPSRVFKKEEPARPSTVIAQIPGTILV